MKIVKKVVYFLLFGLLGLTLYSVVVVIQAGNYMKQTILADYTAGHWRVYKRQPQLMKLRFKDLTPRQIEALVKVQDPGFYKNNGIDFSTPGAGLTTIPQAMAKKLFFKKFKPGLSKYKQTLIAVFVINKHLKKWQQLEIFFNLAYLGMDQDKPIYGFSHAATYYYNKPFNELTDEEYLSLVAMLVAPGDYNLKYHTKRNQDRVNRIKRYLSGEYKPIGLMDYRYGEK